MKRSRQTKIVATLGPASGSPGRIRELFLAGADVFRLNFSHGTQQDHETRMLDIRAIEEEFGRPIAVIADLQGPKLRIGTFADGAIGLEAGQSLRLDNDPAPGDGTRVHLPHPDVLRAISTGQRLLLDDGRVGLRVVRCADDYIDTVVEAGNRLSDRKGLNLPDTALDLTPLTPKDRDDLRCALDIGADWIALSFVQRPSDVAEARRLTAGRAHLIVKMEKPSALDHLDELIEMTDAMMVARGDLGVEMPAEDVPAIQKRIVNRCRQSGKPVIVATQMLESMVSSPTPTRAEASDVATAVYDGADAVMLSAETAAGDYPIESVAIMDRIAQRVEGDPTYRTIMDASHFQPENTAADAITAAARQVARTVRAAAVVTYTTSGSTTLRAARERPEVPILCLTSRMETARRLALCWGCHCVHTADIHHFNEMVEKACAYAHADGLAEEGQRVVITAGVPFGTPGNTNVLRIAWVEAPK